MFFDDAEQVDHKEALIAAVSRLIDVSSYMPDGHILLSRTVRKLHLRATELLLRAGVPVGYYRVGGHTALLDVLDRPRSEPQEKLLPMVELLLKHGAPTEGNTEEGVSALSAAWRLGRPDIIGRLLDAGADPQAMNWDGLMLAVLNGSVEEVALELEYGANMAVGDVWGTTAWHMAFAVGDLEKIELLFAAGADINQPGAIRETPLMVGVICRQNQAVAWLLEQGASLDMQDDDGYSALMRAVEIDDIERVRLLLAAGADVTLNDCRRRNNRDWERDKDPSPVTDLEYDLHCVQHDIFSFENAMSLAQTPEVARLLAAAGARLADINDSLYSRWVTLGHGREGDGTRDEYVAQRYPNAGSGNGRKIDRAYWQAEVRANASMEVKWEWEVDDDDNEEICYYLKRYSNTLTELPDGRLIEIGGAIDSQYGTRFDIYNNVGVHYGGGIEELYGYREKHFPPIDFHTATVVEGDLYIIGGLGYEHHREEGYTPVYKLNCDTYNIERVKTVGDNPGAINRHHALYHPDAGPAGEIHVWGGSIALKNGAGWEMRYGKEWRFVENHAVFILDLKTRRWRRGER